MLRIKNSVNLSALKEKYGFNYIEGSTISFIPNKNNDDLRIDVAGSDDSALYVGSGFMNYSAYDKDLEVITDVLFELIKDDLVEKVTNMD